MQGCLPELLREQSVQFETLETSETSETFATFCGNVVVLFSDGIKVGP